MGSLNVHCGKSGSLNLAPAIRRGKEPVIICPCYQDGYNLESQLDSLQKKPNQRSVSRHHNFLEFLKRLNELGPCF